MKKTVGDGELSQKVKVLGRPQTAFPAHFDIICTSCNDTSLVETSVFKDILTPENLESNTKISILENAFVFFKTHISISLINKN